MTANPTPDPPAPVPAPTPPAGPEVVDLNAAWAAQQGVEPRVVPPPRPLPGWLLAAIIIGLLLLGFLLVAPFRAWVLSALRLGGPAT